MGICSRGLALSVVVTFLAGTSIGSTLPEIGNLTAIKLGISPHAFNPVFLTLGIVGIGVAFYIGYKSGSPHS